MTAVTDPADDIAAWRAHFETVLDGQLPSERAAVDGLHQAMRYAALAGGKRFRPVLVYATGQALGLELARLDPIAAAIEFIHAYSLVHDDLPAMDDDDLRRGRPTCHRAFGEATAILAGDALQALAFEVLAGGLHEEAAGLSVIHEIARACGSAGMAGGQALDLAAVGRNLDRHGLETMHRLKTGALIRAAVTAPCQLAGVDAGTHRHLAAYGDCVGLAFQVHDDILDVAGDAAVTGKNTQADSTLDKPTFVSILGMEESRAQARDLRDRAILQLQHVPGDTAALAWLADYVVSRDR
jgi:farnesyl diphosphate synthase/geranylgeranyl diphosphate synthase type II